MNHYIINTIGLKQEKNYFKIYSYNTGTNFINLL